MNPKNIIRNTLIWLYIALVLSISVVYALSGGELRFIGIAHVQSQEDGQFTFIPIPDDNGCYIVGVNVPAGLTINSQQNWVDNVITATVLKSNPGNNGNVDFTMRFNFVNPSNYDWNSSPIVVDYRYSSDDREKGSMFKHDPTFTAPNVAALSDGSVSMKFKGKIDENVTDAIMFHTTYTYATSHNTIETGYIYFRVEFRGIVKPPHIWP